MNPNERNDMKRTINDYEPELRSLLETLTNHGIGFRGANNGEDHVATNDVNKLVECLTATDEATLYVMTPTRTNAHVFLVLGNEPGVIVCDHTMDPDIEAATDEHYEKWSIREQPTKEVA